MDQHLPPITITVEGEHGTGKTYLTSFLLDALAIAGFTLDTVEDNKPTWRTGQQPHNVIVAHRIVKDPANADPRLEPKPSPSPAVFGPSPVKPTVGRIVHIDYANACRPAIVTGVRSEPNGEDIHYLSVTEFRRYTSPSTMEDVPPSPASTGWHWPQECPDGR